MTGDGDERAILVSSRFDEWAERFLGLESAIRACVPDAAIEHIGSTAVPDLPAKDVVDVMVGVEALSVPAAADALEAAGFDLEGAKPGHCWLALPDRRHRTAVIHVVAFEGPVWTARLAFRDLLRADASARDAYLAAKEEAAAGATGWSDYTAAKYPTVQRLLGIYLR